MMLVYVCEARMCVCAECLHSAEQSSWTLLCILSSSTPTHPVSFLNFLLISFFFYPLCSCGAATPWWWAVTTALHLTRFSFIGLQLQKTCLTSEVPAVFSLYNSVFRLFVQLHFLTRWLRLNERSPCFDNFPQLF